LGRKLGIKPDHVVLLDDAPAGLDLALDLETAARAHVVRRLPRSMHVTLTFHTAYDDLARRLPVLFERTSTAGMVWVCWPKKSAQKALGIDSDLDENRVRDLGLELGFVDVKVAAVDDTWSGLKFVRRLADR
jgi:hypothetical protein